MKPIELMFLTVLCMVAGGFIGAKRMDVVESNLR